MAVGLVSQDVYLLLRRPIFSDTYSADVAIFQLIQSSLGSALYQVFPWLPTCLGKIILADYTNSNHL